MEKNNKERKNLLAQIQEEIVCAKNQINKFGGYSYRSLEDIFESVKKTLPKYDCALIISDEVVQIGDRYYIKATARLLNSDMQVIAETVGLAREATTKKGMDDAQLTGASSSYARKYALNSMFCLDDIKDADAQGSAEQKVKTTFKYDLAKLAPEKLENAKQWCENHKIALEYKDDAILIDSPQELKFFKEVEVKHGV